MRPAGFVLLALPAFLSSVIPSFLPKITEEGEGGGGSGRPPAPSPSPRSATVIFDKVSSLMVFFIPIVCLLRSVN